MLEHADEMRFGEEHLARDARAVLVAARVHVVDLDRDVAPVVRIVREVDDAGAAAADFVDDHVLADLLGNLAGRAVFVGRYGHGAQAEPGTPGSIRMRGRSDCDAGLTPRSPARAAFPQPREVIEAGMREVHHSPVARDDALGARPRSTPMRL